MADVAELEKLAKLIRREILEMIYRTKAPHIGCSFSIVDILAVLYFKILKTDDRFILSKGHAAPALYAVLAEKGIISKEILAGFNKDGGTLEPHPTRNISQGVDVSTGSIGHGLSLGCGLALADLPALPGWQAGGRQGKRVFVLIGDGELDEGSNWEAIMFASHRKLDNLTAIVDRNQCQILGRTEEVLALEPLAQKWRAFGWAVKEVDGHNFGELIKVFESLPFELGKPSCIIAKTTKGKGVSFMENELRWHDKYPDEQEYQKALSEL